MAALALQNGGGAVNVQLGSIYIRLHDFEECLAA